MKPFDLNSTTSKLFILIAAANALVVGASKEATLNTHTRTKLDEKSKITTIDNDPQPASIATVAGECLNNSADNHNCKSEISSTAGNYAYQTDKSEEKAMANNLRLDEPAQLLERIKNIDKLDQNLINYLGKQTNDWHNQDPGPSLRQVLVLHRHGDRAPINFQDQDPLKDEPFWTFHGLGQLTNKGKARLFLLGQMFRQRYNKFMNQSVNKNERISRSSGSLRCIESAQVFLASFLELDLLDTLDGSRLVWDIARNNSVGQMWQPASVQSVPAKLDGMLAESAECKTLNDEYMNVIDRSDEVRAILVKFWHEAELMDSILGFKMDHFYKWFWASGQIEIERTYFGDKLNPKLLAIYDRLDEAGNLAMTAYQSTARSKRLRSGLLISDMIEHMKGVANEVSLDKGDNKIRQNNQKQGYKKIVHYSAHDLTLVILLGMLDSWQAFPTRPDYASNIVLELHQDGGEWFVKLFYMQQVPANSVELHMSRCEDNHPRKRCLLSQFERLMSPYTIASWQAWQSECANDLGQLDVYQPGL